MKTSERRFFCLILNSTYTNLPSIVRTDVSRSLFFRSFVRLYFVLIIV